METYQQRAFASCSSMTPLIEVDYQTQYFNYQLILGALGMMEAAEVLEAVYSNRDNDVRIAKVKKELGDVCWYLALICTALNIQFDEFTWPDARVREYVNSGRFHHSGRGEIALYEASTDLVQAAKNLSEYIKKAIFHFHGVDKDKISELISQVVWRVQITAYLIGTEYEYVLEGNISKLAARYEGGFSQEASQNRKEGDD